MAERGVSVDHSTINRWINKFSPLLEAETRKRRSPVGKACDSMKPTYVSKESGSIFIVRLTKMAKPSPWQSSVIRSPSH